MSPQDMAQTLAWARDITLAGLMFVALVGGRQGWYIWRWTYDRDMADKAATIARLLQEIDARDAAIAKWENRTMRLLHVNEGLADKVPSA